MLRKYTNNINYDRQELNIKYKFFARSQKAEAKTKKL